MDISGRVLREVEFRDRLRGYDTDEVDEFLEKVAVGVDELHAALAKARAELAEAEQHSAASTEEPVFDDASIRRTLVLAQRTADLAIKEAEEEAQRTLEEARGRAESVIARAEEEAQRARDAAAFELQTRVDELLERRDRLEREVTALATLVSKERERLGDALSSALRFVNDTLAVSDELREHASAAKPAPAAEPSAPDTPPAAAAAPEASEDPEPETAPDGARLPRFDFADDLDVDLDDDAEPPAPISDALGNGRAQAGGEVHHNGTALVDDDEELWERWAKGSPLEAGGLPQAEDPFGPDRRGRAST